MRWTTLAVIPALGAFLYASELKGHKVYDFSHGVDTYHSSLSLPESFVQNSLNVLFDDVSPITKRKGFTVAFSSNAFSYQNTWTYTDSTSTSWIIVRGTSSIIANNLSGGASVKIATVSVNDLVSSVNSQSSVFFVDPTQGVYQWNGTSTTYIAGSPKGNIITQWHGRLWVAGQTIPNGNILNGSQYLDGTVWAVGTAANQPVQFTVGLQDNFEKLTALYPYLDTMYAFKQASTYALYGFDQTNFQISVITQECGCVDPFSIQTYNGGLKFVSLRGVEDFNGYACNRISDSIKNKIDSAISQGSFSQQSWILQNALDWNSGAFNGPNTLSVSISAPALVLSTGTANDALNGTFNSTYSNGSSVQLSTRATTVNNGDFETGDLTNWSTTLGSVVASKAGVNCTMTPNSGSYFESSSNVNQASEAQTPLMRVQIQEQGTNIVLTSVDFTAAINNCSWTRVSLSEVGLQGRVGYLTVRDVTDSLTFLITSNSNFVLNGQNMLFSWASDTSLVDSFGINVGIDNFSGGASFISSGTYTTKSVDTLVSNPLVLNGATWSLNGNSPIPSFSFQSSANNIAWTDYSNSTGVTANTNRYLRVISTMTTNGMTNSVGSVNSLSFQWVASSGAFKSPSHAMTGISSFGNFLASQNLNGGSIAYSLCTSSSSDMIPSACGIQPSNAQITVATNTYVDWFATFSVTAVSQAPALNNGVVQWYSGNRPTPMASAIWDNRYWLSVTTNTMDGFNDAVLVLGRTGAWSIFDLHAGGFTQSKGNLYHSDSQGTGNVYIDNQGYNDNGVAINAFIQTKDYCQNDPTAENYYESIYPSMDNGGNYSMSIQYAMDRLNGTLYSLSSINQNEYLANTAIKVPFVLNSSNQNFGKCISYIFTENALGSPWNFYGFTDYYHEREVQ
jgi:hypothetical protein